MKQRTAPNEPCVQKSSSKNGGFQAAKEGWLKWCASYPNLSAADLAVAIALSTYLNSKSRDAWPSMKRLAADVNREPSTVWRALKRLKSMNLIEVVHGRGWKKPNRYRPTLGCLHIDPKSLRRTTTKRGQILRGGNRKAAAPQLKACGPAALTSEEPQRKCREVAFESEPTRAGPTAPVRLHGEAAIWPPPNSTRTLSAGIGTESNSIVRPIVPGGSYDDDAEAV